ncbi:MAG TPA: Rieske 2Fe-2S domain-containing protein [Stellaceae bacterium]|nr:Rieske 2Fe-2S domain-containing protein [Stellaceae bacterium]
MLSAADNELLTRTGKATRGGQYMRRFWLPALLSEEIPSPDSPPVRVDLLGEKLVAFRDSNGRIGLIGRYCAHRQMDLFFGRNEECGLRCVYHGWKFDVNGKCVDMPVETAAAGYKDRIALDVYPCREHAGIIWAYLGPKDLPVEFPQFEFNTLPKEQIYIRKSLLRCNYLQAMEGNLDSSHVNYLHSFATGNALAPGRGGLTLEKDGKIDSAVAFRDINPTFEITETDFGFMVGAKRKLPNGKAYWRITQWLLPVHTMIGFDRGQTLLWDAWVPMDDEHTWVYRVEYNPWRPISDNEKYEFDNVGFKTLNVENIPGTYLPVRNKENDYLIDRMLQRTYNYTGIKGTNAQDAAAIENQGPTAIADRTQEHLGTGDAAIIQMRRKFLRLLADMEKGIEPLPAFKGDLYKVRPIAVTLEDDGTPYHQAAKELVFV